MLTALCGYAVNEESKRKGKDGRELAERFHGGGTGGDEKSGGGWGFLLSFKISFANFGIGTWLANKRAQ
jgi:hypothetical protein